MKAEQTMPSLSKQIVICTANEKQTLQRTTGRALHFTRQTYAFANTCEYHSISLLHCGSNDISCCPDTLQSVQAHGLLMSRPGKRTHHPAEHKKKWHNGKQEEKILGKADTPSGAIWNTKADRTLGKVQHPPTKGNKQGHGATPSNKRKQARAQLETKGDETLGEGHPTKGKKQGRNGEKADTPSNKGKQDRVGGGRTIQRKEQKGSQWETKGEKTLGKADTPSSQRKQERIQWETRGDKTLGKTP